MNNSQIKDTYQKKHHMFLFSNVVFSGSTYLGMIYIPFLLNIDEMADLSILYNAMLILMYLIELGITVSFLRFYQIKKHVLIINSIIQLLLIAFLIILGSTYLGGELFGWLNIANLDTSKELFFLSIICQLSWIFAKNILLTLKHYEYILLFSLSILIVRIIGIYLLDAENINIKNILITFFIIPFIPAALFTIINNLKNIISIRIQYLSMRIINIFLRQSMQFLKFSLFAYIIGLLYILSNRYIILYLSESGQNEMIADLGYAMSFMGIITVFSLSFRTYYISIFKFSDINSINKYLDNYLKKIKVFAFFGILISFGIVTFFLLVKPEYLSINSVIFLLIKLISAGLVLLFSLITFLARTMNFNRLELKINLVRFFLVCGACHSIIPLYPIFGFIIINLIIVLVEIYFSKIVLRKLKYAY